MQAKVATPTGTPLVWDDRAPINEWVNKVHTVKTKAEWQKEGHPVAALVGGCEYISYEFKCGDDPASTGNLNTGNGLCVRLRYDGTWGWIVDFFLYPGDSPNPCRPSDTSVDFEPYPGPISGTISCGNAGSTVGDIRNMAACNPQGIYECGQPTGTGFNTCAQHADLVRGRLYWREGGIDYTQDLDPTYCEDLMSEDLTATVSF